MPNRILILIAVLVWYATVRMAIYRYFIPRVMSHNGKVDEFDWWFSWAVALPMTGLTIVLGWFAISFVWHGF